VRLSYAEAAAHLGIKLQTLRAMVCQKRVPHVRLGGRLVVFDSDVLDAWLAEKTAKAPEFERADTLHNRLIDKVVREHGASRKGFAAAIRKAVTTCDAADYFRWWRFIPDAYRVDEAEMVVTVWEVEVTSRISEEKVNAYINLFWFLDYEDWSLRMLTMSHLGVVGDLDLFAASCERSKESA